MRTYNFIILALIASLFSYVNGKNACWEQVAVIDSESVACRDVRTRFVHEKKMSKCHFRMTPVKLQVEPGYAYFPDVVSVRRCHGYCSNDISCMPIETNKTTVVVKREHISTGVATCQKITVEEHTGCKCLCDVMKHHCNAKQDYYEDQCACKCMNMEEQRKCKKMEKRKWDSKNCKCICDVPEEECSTGLQWVPSLCRCVLVKMDEMNLIKN